MPPPKRRNIRRTLISSLLVIFSVFLVAFGCSYLASPPPPACSPGTTGNVDGTCSSAQAPQMAPYGMSPEDIERYLDDCAQNVNNFKGGAALTYPKSLDIDVNDSQAYVAVLDLSGEGSPELIPNGAPTGTAIAVQCEVTAQLIVPPDGSLRITDSGDNSRKLAPTGRAQWSWSVTALKPGNHDLQLAIQPALVVDRTVYQSDPSTQRLTFVTDVNGHASFWQSVGFWASDNWPPILAVATAVGAATVGLVKWAGSMGEALGNAKQGWRRNPHGQAQGSGQSPPQTEQRRESGRSGYM
jgi:hypothetical protein